MRIRILGSLLALMLMGALVPVSAAGEAKRIGYQGFSTSTEGWTPEGSGGSITRETGEAGAAPNLRVSSTSNTFLARSPAVGSNVGRFVWHFRTSSSTASAIVMGGRGPNDEKVFDVSTASGSVYSGSGAGHRYGVPGGTSWHRLDVVLKEGGYQITLDGGETHTVVPTNNVPIHSFIVAPRSAATVYIDNISLWNSSDPLETAFINEDPRFLTVSSGLQCPGTITNCFGGGVRTVNDSFFLDKGAAFISGSGNPLTRQFITWSIADLAPQWETNLGFLNANSVFLPDHMAVLAGLSEVDSSPLWALTLAPGVHPNPPNSLFMYFVDAQGNATPLLGEINAGLFYDLRVVADEDASKLDVWVGSQNVGAITDASINGTSRLAIGDVYTGPGTYVATGLTLPAPTGYGEMHFDDIESSSL
ncbi:MAG: hypothetical protein ABIS18_04000 [Actinomycetota bacterium]